MTRRALVAMIAVAALSPVVAGAARAGTDVGAAGIQVTTPSPASFTSYGGIRFQAIGSASNTGDEYLGVADLGATGNRIEANFTVSPTGRIEIFASHRSWPFSMSQSEMSP